MMIFIVNNHGQYNHRIHRTLRYLNIPSKMIPNTIPVDTLLDNEPEGIIIGGGPSIEEAGNSIEYIKRIEVPILGICLGHQLMALAFNGKVASAEAEEYAQIEIEILDEDDIFKGLGAHMSVWASHKDEVKILPRNFKILARSNICEIEAMKHVKRPLYGVQFHPEVHHTPEGPMIFKNFYNVCEGVR
ncbi:MAG TPA: GMP synthase subunit A [Methanothermobacter sp.]|nr:GMP synthase subunit A [Methanothermobacter sp.]HOK72657.1 GMP synthase subunit A [Methanothermobacter sp.]HOL68623.1 GMP synthase subunit A [Methanothermobacter sp.]HPQ04382.1 GMP synthase subunit A [Methanothermobacter sp.]HPU36573.1 GMP synthase subunit A [Methanothermobacter sp.]